MKDAVEPALIARQRFIKIRNKTGPHHRALYKTSKSLHMQLSLQNSSSSDPLFYSVSSVLQTYRTFTLNPFPKPRQGVMAKEGNLKKIDLKVSVICCDGCKRKVKKALQSIPGVLETQIDALQPKVTVTGKVDAQTLIKRLGRVGKQAELWPSENQKANKEEKKAGSNDKDVEVVTVSGKDKENTNDGKKSSAQLCKCSGLCNTDKSKESESGNSGGNKKGAEKDQKQGEEDYKNERVTKNTHPPPQEGIVHEAGNIGSYASHYCFIEPSTVAYPCYAINAYSAPPPYHFQDRYIYDLPMTSRVVVQTPGPRFTDYFNDENTAGCSVM